MASTTPNIGLTLPTGAEKVSRQIINGNNTLIDTAIGSLSTQITNIGKVQSGTWTPTFPRDTATGVTGHYYLNGNILMISAEWTNTHISGQGNSYILKDSLPSIVGITKISGFHGSWHGNNDTGGECGQMDKDSSFWFTKGGEHFQMAATKYALVAICSVSF